MSRKRPALKMEQEQFMEQVYRTNTKAGKESLLSGQKEALCEQLNMSENDVEAWFRQRGEEEVPNKRMKTSRGGPANRTRSGRPGKNGIDFSERLNEVSRPLPRVTNADLDNLGQYCCQLAEAARGIATPAGYCSALSRVAARASIYLEDRDFASSLGVLMVLVEEFAIAREYLDDQFGLVDMFGRLLVRQCAHAVLSANWNVVDHPEELAKNFANVMCNAHILFRSYEIKRRKEWEKVHAGKSSQMPPPKGVQHLDVVAHLARCPWDSDYMQDILNGRSIEGYSGGNGQKAQKIEPSMITDVRLEVLSHAKDYESIHQALFFSRFHLNSFLNSTSADSSKEQKVMEDDDGDDKKDTVVSRMKSDSVIGITTEKYGEDPGFDEYLEHKLKVSVVQLYFKLQQWGTASQLCRLSFDNDVTGMTDILQLLIKAAKTFPTAREPALLLANHAIGVEWCLDSYYISSKLTQMWVNFMAEFFTDKLCQHVGTMLDKMQLIAHARFLLEAFTPYLKRIVANSGIGDPLVEQIVRLGVDVALRAWKLDRTECKMPPGDMKKKSDERAVICDWMMDTFTMLGTRSHEIGLLAALASFALAPDFSAFMLIKRLHTQPHTSDERGPSLHPTQHRELVTLLSRECSDQGLTCLQDPNLNWTKLTHGLLKTKCSTYTTVKICLDEKMYDQAIKGVEHAIRFILPPQLSNAKNQKTFASEAYDALQQMLADRNFVTENPQFCYDSAHTLVHNIIRVGSGHGKPNELANPNVPSGQAASSELAHEHFHLLYDAVRVMCFVVNSVDHSRRFLHQNPHNTAKVNLANVNISVGKLYEDLDGLKDLQGLPKDHSLLKKLWAGMAEVIQTSLGAQTTQQLLISKNIISSPEESSYY